MKEIWLLIAVMSLEKADGTIEMHVSKDATYASQKECQNYVKENGLDFIRSVSETYGWDKPIRQILCLPEENLKKFSNYKK